MEPQIVKRPAMTVVGLVVSGKSVGDIDICGLWNRFDRESKKIKGAIKGKTYELHIEEDSEPRLHLCVIGLEVKKVRDLPAEMFAKTVPAGQYALFTHSFKDGGFREAFQNVYAWLKRSKYSSAHHFDIQHYNRRFKSPQDPKSQIDILVPIKKK